MRMKVISLSISMNGSIVDARISRAPSVFAEPYEYEIENLRFENFVSATRKVTECLNNINNNYDLPNIAISINPINVNIETLFRLDDTIIKTLEKNISGMKISRYFIDNVIHYY